MEFPTKYVYITSNLDKSKEWFTQSEMSLTTTDTIQRSFVNNSASLSKDTTSQKEYSALGGCFIKSDKSPSPLSQHQQQPPLPPPLISNKLLVTKIQNIDRTYEKVIDKMMIIQHLNQFILSKDIMIVQ
ncbi:hypothetical protein ACTFIY_003641 [Dictyostelium cf. discoideum]